MENSMATTSGKMISGSSLRLLQIFKCCLLKSVQSFESQPKRKKSNKKLLAKSRLQKLENLNKICLFNLKHWKNLFPQLNVTTMNNLYQIR